MATPTPPPGPYFNYDAPPGMGVCQVCRRSPAAPLSMEKQTGMVLSQRSATANVVVCHPCGTAMFRQAQAHNIAFGWWGIIAFFANISALIGNSTRFREHRSVGAPTAMPLATPLNPGRPVWQRWQMIVPVALIAALVAVVVDSTGRSRVPALDVGQCIDVPSTGTFSDVKLVPCAEPHDAEVAGVLSAADTPSSTATDKACAELAASRVLPSRIDEVDLSTLVPETKSADSKEDRKIRAVCLLTGVNDAKLTGRVTNG